jgi:predicted DCC family thiol-disulfide oxidoreductase YuxK
MPRPSVIYDEDCGFCRWSADRLRAWDRRQALRFVPLQDRETDRLLEAIPRERRGQSWHLVEPDGRVWSAGAAVPRVLHRLPLGAPFATIAEAAPSLTDRAYSAAARRRTALGRLLGQRACAVDPARGSTPTERLVR